MKAATQKNIRLHVAGVLYRRVLGLANALVKPKLLDPELFGLWNLLNLIPTYAAYSHLGSRSAMRFQIPWLLGRGETAAMRQVEAAVWRGSFCLALVITLLLSLAALLGPWTGLTRWGILTMALLVMLEWRFHFQISLLKARQQFPLIAKANVAKATATVFLGITLLLAFGLPGLFAAVVLATLLTIVFLHRRQAYTPEPGFHWPTFVGLVRQGFPIMAFGLGNALMISSDRLVVAVLLGTQSLGYYGIAAMAFGFLMQVPGAAREVVEPQLMAKASRLGSAELVTDFLFRPLLNTAFLFAPTAGLVFLAAPIVVPWILPRYALAVAPAQWLAFASILLAQAYVARGLIVARNRQTTAAIVQLGLLPVNAALSYLLIRWFDMGLSGAAVGSGITFALAFVGLTGLAWRVLTLPILPWLRWWGAALFATALPMVLMVALAFWFHPYPDSPVLEVTLRMAFFLSGCFVSKWLTPRLFRVNG